MTINENFFRVTAEIGANLSQMVLRDYGTLNDTTVAIDSLQIR